MTERERHQRAAAIFHAAADLSGPARVQYVAHACASDAELRRAVERLLAADAQAGDTLEKGVHAHIMAAFSNIPANYPIGQTFGGRYLIKEEIGRGGIGAVYRAQDTRFHGRSVVVKVLLPASLSNPVIVDLFKKEAEGLSRISHGRVVRALDIGYAPLQEPYLVMEFVAGHTLAQEIQCGRIELALVATFLRDAAQGLTAAHHQQVIHRDLKTVNLMVEQPSGGAKRLKLIDFGIAKVENPVSAETTQFPISVGTPSYMPPEQVKGELATPASDIYALGVVAYEMVTGVLPFVVDPRNNPAWRADLLAQQQAGVKVTPQQLCSEISDVANEEILRALTYEGTARQQNAFEFGERLFAALTQQQYFVPTQLDLTTLAAPTVKQKFNEETTMNPAIAAFERLWANATHTDLIRPLTLANAHAERQTQRGLGAKPKTAQYRYRLGDELCLALDIKPRVRGMGAKPTRDGYLTLLDQGPEGIVYCLCPSMFAPETYITAGRFYLPQAGAPYPAFELSGTPGQEKLLAIISDEPLGLDWLSHDPNTPARELSGHDIKALFARLQQMGADRWTALSSYFEVAA